MTNVEYLGSRNNQHPKVMGHAQRSPIALTRSTNSVPSVGKYYRNLMYTVPTVGKKRTIESSVSAATRSDLTGRSVPVVVVVHLRQMFSTSHDTKSLNLNHTISVHAHINHVIYKESLVNLFDRGSSFVYTPYYGLLLPFAS